MRPISSREPREGRIELVKDDAVFEADHAYGEGDEHEEDRFRGRIRHRPPERETAGNVEERPEQDPGTLAAGAVGDGAQKGRRQRDQDSRNGHHPAEHGLAGNGVGRDGGGEIGREDEGQEQGVVGLVCPVEPPPAPDLTVTARFSQRDVSNPGSHLPPVW
jgi:hypothetical protein